MDQKPPRHTDAARLRRDEHGFHLRVAILPGQRGAAQQHAVLLRAEKGDRGIAERLDVEKEILLRRKENLHQRVAFAQQRRGACVAR